MAIRKQNKKYYFTVEGETEKWYFDWLQKTINQSPDINTNVSFDCKVEKDPVKRAKSINMLSRTTIYHISDYESNDEIHTKQFIRTMDQLAKAKTLGKQIDYQFGYSNLTFDLWIILHKLDCKKTCVHRDHYIRFINSAYQSNYENMDQYKKKANFERILNTLTIDDVISAIRRAKAIMKQNEENGYTLHTYKQYTYYKENPSLMIWEPIEKILIDCGLIPKSPKNSPVAPTRKA